MSNELTKEQRAVMFAKGIVGRAFAGFVTDIESSLENIEVELKNKRISISSAKYKVAYLYSLVPKAGTSALTELDNIHSSISEEEYTKISAKTGIDCYLLMTKIEANFQRLFGINDSIENHLKNGEPIKKLFGLF